MLDPDSAGGAEDVDFGINDSGVGAGGGGGGAPPALVAGAAAGAEGARMAVSRLVPPMKESAGKPAEFHLIP